MKTAWCTVVESERLYGETFVLWLEGPAVVRGATPGRFVMLRCHDDPPSTCADGDAGGYGPPLFARPMSYHRLRPGPRRTDASQFAILYDVVGRGTAWLSRREPGDRVFVHGPLGRGFRLRRASQNLLLIGGGIGVAPLVWLADEAAKAGKNVVMLLGARTAAGVFPAPLLPREVELVATTDDGSLGRRGLVTEAAGEYLSWADQVFACGPVAMFRALADVVRRHEGEGVRRGRKSVQVLMEEVMPCGTGICYGCGTMTKRGVRLICRHGPMFELRDVF